MPADGDDVEDDMVLTQLGAHELRWESGIRTRHHFSFRSALRADRDEEYMSLVAGRMSLAEIVPLVNRGDTAGGADAVRYTVAGELRKAGFEIKYKKSRTIPSHVAVRWPGEWDGDVLSRFDQSFREYEWCGGER